MKIKFNSTQRITSEAKDVLKRGLTKAFGEDASVRMVRSEPGPDVVNFGGAEGIQTLSPMRLCQYPNGAGYAAVAFRKATQEDLFPVPWDCDPNQVLYFDIESHSASDIWKMAPRQFFRLGQYAWGPQGDVHVTTDYDEMLSVMSQAYGVVGHNIHNFDLSALHGTDSLVPLEMAMKGRVFDTFVHAILAIPAPDKYENRAGQTLYGDMSPANTLKWLGLDNLCFQLGLDGKEGDLKALAKKYNPKGTLVSKYNYGLIPQDDPDYVEYAVQDVKALQELACALLIMSAPSEYDWRTQLTAAIDAQISRNGWTVDLSAAQSRVDELKVRRDEILRRLEEDYGFPTTGKSPWASSAGKAAIMKALADQGITEASVPDWERTATGNLSLGGEVLLTITEGTPAQEFGEAVAELKGQRSLAQLAIDSTQPDGKAHPNITAVQRSGRRSLSQPGLTVWSARGDKAVEKKYFTASPGRKLVEMDYSAADSRIVAAYSGDTEFAKRFEPGADAHNISGEIFFGAERFYADIETLRPMSKAANHALAYRVGSKKLAAVLGLTEDEGRGLIASYQSAYPEVARWQDEVTELGKRGYLVNDWGRQMVVQPDRSFTQSSALLGQSGTTCLLEDALIRIVRFDIRIIRWVVATIHDAVIFDIPEDELDWAVPKIKSLMEAHWGPSNGTGQVIHFPVGSGKPADDWYLAAHG